MMVEAGEASLKRYFEESRKWEQDAYLQALRSKRVWQIAALVLGLTTFGAVSAVAMLTPLKTVEPFVVRVDNATGIVETMSALKEGPSNYDEAVSRYFLANYVRAREAFLFDEAEHNFRTVGLLSTPEVQEAFAQSYAGSNPQSPQNVYGRRAVATVQIRSISFINERVAQVRYFREVREMKSVTRTSWIATMTFGYVNAEISSNDRLINPLGLVVSEYRTAEEVTGQ